jgi:hypothetical protein
MDSPTVYVILEMSFIWKDQRKGLHNCWPRVWCKFMREESDN